MTLEVDDVSVGFGGVLAVDSVSLVARPGEIVGLIGPNGAGKTTLINAVAGTVTPQKGRIRWNGRALTGRPPFDIVRDGVGRTFQNVTALHDLTVLDLVRLGAASRERPRLLGLGSIWRSPAADRRLDRVLIGRVLTPLALAPYADHLVQTLSYGLRKTADLARALAIEPRLLLLDEPVAGLTRHEAAQMADIVLGVRQATGCAVVLVEHKMDVVMRVCDRVAVLASGRLIFDGAPAAARTDPEVRRVYLGTAGTAA